jgi:adenylate cyclase
MKRTLKRSAILAFIALLVGDGIDFLTHFEMSIGLDTLFKIRGARQPPAEVVVIAMDEKTEERFAIGQNLGLLRGLHAHLIRELNIQGAALVIFDLQFTASHPDQDPAFATAMQQAGNVLLTDCVQKFEIGGDASSGLEQCYDESNRNNKPLPEKTNKPDQPNAADEFVIWSKTPPTATLAQSSLDHAPFYLSFDAKNPTIREVWTFIDPLANEPTLPVVAWLYYLQRTGILQDFQPTPPISDWLANQRKHCTNSLDESSIRLIGKPGLEEQIRSIICHENSRFLDFYGSQQTLRMESYSDVYDGKVNDLQGKVVFVGKSNRSTPSGNEDYFITPYPARSGRMAGVEIMATQFANLLEMRFVVSPLPTTIFLTIFGLVISLLLNLFSGLIGIGASLMFSAAYVGLAVFYFNQNGIWLPVAVPLLIQLPVTLLLSLLWSRRDLLNERKRLLAFVSQVSPKWMDLVPLSEKQFPTLINEPAPDRYINGVCLLTDIKDYTSMLESHPLDQSLDLLKRYYQVLGAPVYSHRGVIANIQSDAMMALWFDLKDYKQREEACLAALEIQIEVEIFNKTSGFRTLPTRIGIYEGEMVLGSGRAGEFIFSNPFGNPTNRASRIEGVNKHLGTKILASAGIAASLTNIIYRDVGFFRVVGIKEPINLVEIVAKETDSNTYKRNLYKQFMLGLKAFQLGQWDEAANNFKLFLEIYGQDSPSQYFLDFMASYQGNPPSEWDGVVTIEWK